MGDEVTCETCGRPNAALFDLPTTSLCFAALGDDCETCWRIAYEREKARAEAAEAELEAATATFEDEQAAHIDTIAALAAARRALLEISAGNLDNEPPDAFQERACDVARAALAAPAAGDSK